MAECYVEGALIEEQLCKIATQYRNSTNLKDFIAVFLKEVEAVQKALCDTKDVDIDRLGTIINFPRCWCNIKKKTVFGLEKGEPTYFGFDYVAGETVVTPAECLGGLNDGQWITPSDNPDCALEALKNCCSASDPTIEGLCTGDLICPQYPEYVDHCFDDDVEYAMLLNAKLASDKSTGTVDDVLNVAIIMYGDQTTLFFDQYGEIWISVNRALTDNEIFLMDFYKTLLPAPVGVSVTIVDGLNSQFGATTSPCLTDRIDGFCDGVFMRRY